MRSSFIYKILKIHMIKQEIFQWNDTIMDEINNFLQRGNKKIINIQVVKDFDAGVTGVNYIVFYDEGVDFTF
ncbi:hypothetical protein [Candidatus Nitrosocosmicus sp. R]